MQFSSHGRNMIASVDDVVRTVTRRVEGIRRLLNNHPTEESLQQYHQDVVTLSEAVLQRPFRKRCFENMQHIYRRTPMPKCYFKSCFATLLKLHFGMGVLL